MRYAPEWMNRFRLHPPVVVDNTAYFSWETDPPSSLYWKSSFFLKFPQSIDLSKVPPGAWGLIAMLCLHANWVLLRPCLVELPFTLMENELEVWNRLMDSTVVTHSFNAKRRDIERSIVFHCDGPCYPPPAPLEQSERCAVSFSGGKDSLLQTGLLTELTSGLVLVATTSPLRIRSDHLTERRRYVFDTIPARRDVTFVDVESDLRSNVDIDFSHAVAGYPTSVTEMTETFLYFSSMFAVSLALGATHLFQAAEAEVQESIESDGRIVQHSHCMYAIPAQAAITALISPYGMRFCSATSPLYAVPVHRLLWTRYSDISDLQYSCWRVNVGEDCCNNCGDCLKYAFGILSVGDRPARMGIDLIKVMRNVRNWAPREIDLRDSTLSPNLIAAGRQHRHLMRTVRETSVSAFEKAMQADHPGELSSPNGLEAFRCFEELKNRLDPLAPEAFPGFREGFLEFVDPLVREGIRNIYRSHFEPEPEHEYAPQLSRSKRLAAWICEPLG